MAAHISSWGYGGQRHIRSDDGLQRLRPDHANQRGRLYPAMDAAPAVVTVEGIVPSAWVDAAVPLGATHLARTVRPHGLEALARHGVPTRVGSDARAVTSLLPPEPFPNGPAATTLAIAILGVIWWHRWRGATRPA
jgi:hypothetical protein